MTANDAFLDGLNVLDESESAEPGSLEPSSAGSESTPSRARAA